MNDREMFEFAAKAAGWFAQNWAWVEGEGFVYQLDGRRVVWNPRDDDGDSFRLMVRLNIPVFPYGDETSTGTVGVVAKNWGSKETNTRRAIFRAAVEIGRHMK